VAKPDGMGGTSVRGSLSSGRGRGGRVRKLPQQKTFGDENDENQVKILKDFFYFVTDGAAN